MSVTTIGEYLAESDLSLEDMWPERLAHDLDGAAKKLFDDVQDEIEDNWVIDGDADDARTFILKYAAQMNTGVRARPIPAIYREALLAQDDVAIDEDDFEDAVDLDTGASQEDGPDVQH